MTKQTAIGACLACLVVGYLVASVPGFDPINPFVPKHDRPVIRFLARIAKLGLWMSVFAEPAPQTPGQRYAAARHDVGSVCHAEGW
jgi:hypothetical protein